MEKRNIKLDLETAKKWYKGGDETLKELALQAYKKEELKDSLPNSWEEFCDKNEIKDGECYINTHSDIAILNNTQLNSKRHPFSDRNLLPNKKSAESHLALMQLEQLRDCYRQGWEPNWDNAAYVIYNFRNEISCSEDPFCSSHFLSFPTEELCEKFYNNFKDLIEQAKDLI